MVNGLRNFICSAVKEREDGVVCSLDGAGTPICTDPSQNSDG